MSVIESVVEDVDGSLHLEVGDYKLVSWSSTVQLPAQVTCIADGTDDVKIEVSAMKKRGKDIFVWDCQCGQVADVLASCTNDDCRHISYIYQPAKSLMEMLNLYPAEEEQDIK